MPDDCCSVYIWKHTIERKPSRNYCNEFLTWLINVYFYSDRFQYGKCSVIIMFWVWPDSRHLNGTKINWKCPSPSRNGHLTCLRRNTLIRLSSVLLLILCINQRQVEPFFVPPYVNNMVAILTPQYNAYVLLSVMDIPAILCSTIVYCVYFHVARKQ